jgi:hypothetical protein
MHRDVRWLLRLEGVQLLLSSERQLLVRGMQRLAVRLMH